MTQKQLQIKLERLKEIGITTADDLLELLEYLPKRKEGTFKKQQSLSLEVRVKKVLRRLGVSTKLKGYQFVTDSIMLVVENPKNYERVSVDIYPLVAQKNQTTAKAVERNIRHAIELSCLRGNVDEINELFGNTIDSRRGRPTNNEFITIIADRIRMGED